MKFKISKVKGHEYLQIWSDDNTACVSIGRAEKLVNSILDPGQTNKLRSKLTNKLLSLGGRND